MEIFVLPGSGLITAPRRAPEKSIRRRFSAATFPISLLFALVGFPSRNDANRVRLSVCIDDYEQLGRIAETKRDEPVFVTSSCIVSRKREHIFEHRDRLSEHYAIGAQIRGGLLRVPREAHDSECIDDRLPVQYRWGGAVPIAGAATLLQKRGSVRRRAYSGFRGAPLCRRASACVSKRSPRSCQG